MNKHVLEHSDEILINVHSESICKPPCAIHSMTDHCMRSFPQHWRSDRFMIERICSHGVGHPDPDQYFVDETAWVHGCDGCCNE